VTKENFFNKSDFDRFYFLSFINFPLHKRLAEELATMDIKTNESTQLSFMINIKSLSYGKVEISSIYLNQLLAICCA